jgi:hypothetical protein
LISLYDFLESSLSNENAYLEKSNLLSSVPPWIGERRNDSAKLN